MKTLKAKMTKVNSDLADEVDEQAHEALLKDLKALGKKNQKASSTHVVRLNPNTIPHFNIKNLVFKLGSIFLGTSDKDFEPLLPPLEKPTANRLKRAAGYEEVVDDVNKWESLVDKQRHAEQVSFPLDQSAIRMKEDEIDLKPSMKTNLEKEVYALLTSSQPKPKDPKSEDLEAARRTEALREVRLETSEVIRRRNLRLRLEKKMSLLNKSKSRKYHQILRRERMRKQKETFERLRTKDPQAALEILQEIEKERIKERLTLRHRNSKWVQTLQARSKHDPEARAALQENIDMRNELLEKVKDLQQEQEGALQEQEELIAKGVFGQDNAWLSQLARAPAPTPVDPEEEKSFGEMKRFWEDVNRRREIDKEAQKVVEELEKRAEEEEREDVKLKERVSSSPMNSEEGAGRPQEATPIPSVKGSTGGKEGGAVARGEAPAKGASKKRKAKVGDREEVLPSSKVVKGGEENAGQRQEAPPKKGKKKKSEAMTGSDPPSEGQGEEKAGQAKVGSRPKGKKKKSDAVMAGSDSPLNGDAEVGEREETSQPSKVGQSKQVPPQKGAKGKKKKDEASPPSKVVNGEEKGGQPPEATPQKRKKKKGASLAAGEGVKRPTQRLLDAAFVDEAFDRAEKVMIEKVAKASFEEDDPSSHEEEPPPAQKDDFEFDLTIKDNEVQIDECLPGEPAPEENVAPTLNILEDPSNPPPPAASVVNIRDDDVLKMKPRPMGQSAWAEITALSDDEEVDVGDSELVQLFEDDEENLKAFKTKKEEEEEDSRVKDVDMFQDGWGSWTGPGIEPVKPNKKQKHMIKALPQEKHPFNKLGNVIYREDSDVHSNLRKLMVSQLPFPFTRVKDFEASVRQSIGRQFVPEALHRKLTKPRVVTKMGAVIPPMDNDTLIKHEKSKRKTTLEKKLERKFKRPTLIARTKTQKRKPAKIKNLAIK